ncbi:acid protease [Gyrodon lividus]|nr:acid protease [Gyrodon lividus]
MRFISIFSVSALLALATALPHHAPLSIALRKRSNITKSGIVDLNAVRSHVARLEAKYLRGVAAFGRNTGVSPSSSQGNARRATGSDALTDDGNERWYGTITVGTPAVEYKVDFDTGSADLFLPASSCGSTCDGHALYDPNISSSAVDLNKTFTLAYGDGSTVLGEQYFDTVGIAGFIAKSQTLGAASQYSTGFQTANFAPDGLMGMAFEDISEFTANPVVQTLIAEGAISDPVFAFKLASSGSELRIGGVNSALYTGSFTYTPVTEEGFWMINGDAINVNGSVIVKAFPAIVDTGSTYILGDAATVGQFYDPLNATDIGSGFYTLPCNSMPSVSITIGGKTFVLSAETFNLGSYDSSGETCVGGILATGSLGDTWILGDAFLRNVYSVFDIGNLRVGFADLA